VEERGEAKYT